jgi:hypothetical protein
MNWARLLTLAGLQGVLFIALGFTRITVADTRTKVVVPAWLVCAVGGITAVVLFTALTFALDVTSGLVAGAGVLAIVGSMFWSLYALRVEWTAIAIPMGLTAAWLLVTQEVAVDTHVWTTFAQSAVYYTGGTLAIAAILLAVVGWLLHSDH